MAIPKEQGELLPAYDSATDGREPEATSGQPVIIAFLQNKPYKEKNKKKIVWNTTTIISQKSDVMLLKPDTTYDDLKTLVRTKFERRFNLKTPYDELWSFFNVNLQSNKLLQQDQRVAVNQENWEAVAALLKKDNSRLEMWFREVESTTERQSKICVIL